MNPIIAYLESMTPEEEALVEALLKLDQESLDDGAPQAQAPEEPQGGLPVL